MHRYVRLAIALAVVSAASVGQAQAQYYGGYGGYGWGGWDGGGTVQGSIARGLGFYNMGAGIYNQETAVANAINTDTVMRWNQYLWESQQEANRRDYLRRARAQQRDKSLGDTIYQRLRDNPSDADVRSGDALNVALDQMTDPRIHSSALRQATQPIASEVIREIPFQNASEGVTLSLNQLTARDEDWPPALQGEQFAPERQAYQEAIATALEEDEAGPISPKTLARVKLAAAHVRAKFDANRPKDPKRRVEAENYVKALTGMARMLENPQTDQVLGKLKGIPKTSLGNLLGFMHTYNLRFGPATTPKQRSVYTTLYPLLDAQRDSLLRDLKQEETSTAAAKLKSPDFFQGMQMDYLEGKTKKAEAK